MDHSLQNVILNGAALSKSSPRSPDASRLSGDRLHSDSDVDADGENDADAHADAGVHADADADAELLEAVDATEANNGSDEDWIKKEDGRQKNCCRFLSLAYCRLVCGVVESKVVVSYFMFNILCRHTICISATFLMKFF